MPSTEKFEIRMGLKKDGDRVQTAHIQFEVSGKDVVNIRGLNDEGEEVYAVSFIIRVKNERNGCWLCLEPPCPPNPPTWFNPCPIAPTKPL